MAPLDQFPNPGTPKDDRPKTAARYVNREGLPKLKSREWAWVLREKGGDPTFLAFGCPCGKCAELGAVTHNVYISVNRESSPGTHQWLWDGDWYHPTLTPSIRRRGACEWHGYMRKGKFVEV